MMKFLLCCWLSFLPFFLLAQETLLSEVQEFELTLSEKDKKTQAAALKIQMPKELIQRFERIDAVFISSWMGQGTAGKEQYRLDSIRMNLVGTSLIAHYAAKHPKTFSRPNVQTGNGMELVIFKPAAKEKCITKYRKKRIAPRGIYPCLLKRSFSTTAVDFIYRLPLGRTTFQEDKLHALVRTSAIDASISIHLKVIFQVSGQLKGE